MSICLDWRYRYVTLKHPETLRIKTFKHFALAFRVNALEKRPLHWRLFRKLDLRGRLLDNHERMVRSRAL